MEQGGSRALASRALAGALGIVALPPIPSSAIAKAISLFYIRTACSSVLPLPDGLLVPSAIATSLPASAPLLCARSLTKRYGEVTALDGLSLLRQAGVPEHLAEMVREMHETTWYAVQGGKGVLETRCGTRPGVPMGDFIFLFFLAARMRTLEERLRGLGIWCELEWDGRRTLQGRLAGPLPPGGAEVGAAGVALLDLFR